MNATHLSPPPGVSTMRKRSSSTLARILSAAKGSIGREARREAFVIAFSKVVL